MPALILPVFLAAAVCAQPAPALRFETLSIAEGLSSVRVWDVLQDQRGFLWVATGEGLDRYDGNRMTVYRADGPGTLSHDQVWDLFEDHAGMLWAGTFGGGLNRFDPATETFTHYRHDPADPNSLGDDRIRVIYETPRAPGVLWIGTYGGGLDRFDTRTETFTHHRRDPADGESLPGDFVYALHEDRAGRLWVGTRGGLARVVPAGSRASSPAFSFERVPLPEGLAGRTVTSIAEDAAGGLWMGLAGVGLLRMASAGAGFVHYRHDPDDPASLGSDHVIAVMVDGSGMVWAGTYGGGISRLNPATGAFTRFRHRPGDDWSLSHDVVRVLYEDRSGLVWAGTFGGGLDKIRPVKFFVHRYRADRSAGLLGGRMAALAEDGEGAIWAGMADGGLTRITRAGGHVGYRHYFADADEEQERRRVLSLLTMPERPGVLWAGTRIVGLFEVDTGSGRLLAHYVPPDLSGNASVIAMHASACEPGKIWVTTPEGLSLFDPAAGAFEEVLADVPFGEPQPGLHGLQTSIADPCTLWLTAGPFGLVKLTAAPSPAGGPRTYAVERYPYTGLGVPEGPSVLNIYILHTQTPDGRLWLSRLNGRGGLVAFDPETEAFTAYTEADGLLSGAVYAAETDEDGRLWVANGFGLSHLDPVTGSIRNYGEADGLSGAEWWRATLRGSDGTLYFAGLGALTEVPPGGLPHNEHVPPVALTGFRIGDVPVPVDPGGAGEEPFTLRRSIAYTEALELPPGADVLTFEFATLDFTAPSKNRYVYRLEGFDRAWRTAGAEPAATYTNLDPGRYVFRVRGANNDGVWNETGVRLALTIRPPWYQTVWAYLAYALLALSAAAALVRARERRLRHRAQTLEAAVAERTERLRTQQERLEAQAEALEEANTLQSRFLANISHEFRTPLTLTFGPIDDVLDGRYGLDDAARPHFERARRNGHRLLRLINQLLELSRLDAGALRLDARRYDLADHLRQIAVLFQDVATQQGLDFAIDLPDEPFPHVFDPDKVEKVAVNLLSNAIKFTPAGGRVVLALRREPDGGARLTVGDTGVGVDAAHLTKLFDRFFQVESAETRRHEGSGIGLALVRELVALHGGRVEVESRPGHGTTFTVHLPVLDEATATAGVPTPPAADEPAAYLGARDYLELVEGPAGAAAAGSDAPPEPDEDATVVLVVEDNVDLRAYLRAHLEDDYTVVEATNGRAGLERARAWVPDLVLSDVMMPEMDGLALTDALKTDARTSHIPVLLLTAKAEVEHRIAGFEAGADAYLPKPFDAGELRVRVRALVEERRRLRALFGEGKARAGAEAGTEAGVDTEAEPAPALPPREAAFLADVLAEVEAHLGDPDYGVDPLAEALFMSRRQLARKLKALTDETPGALLRRLRLERAVVLIREGAPLKAVADAVGFRDYSAFSRAFSNAYGTAPSAYDGAA